MVHAKDTIEFGAQYREIREGVAQPHLVHLIRTSPTVRREGVYQPLLEPGSVWQNFFLQISTWAAAKYPCLHTLES
jgi:hypothetical protein